MPDNYDLTGKSASEITVACKTLGSGHMGNCIKCMFQEGLKTGLEQGESTGIIKGIKKGRVEGGLIGAGITVALVGLYHIPVVHKKCTQLTQYTKNSFRKLTSHADHEKQENSESEPPTEE